MTTDEQELQRWREALAQQPTEEDFSALTGYREEEPPWRWRTLVENLAPMADRVLVLGTGRGEALAALVDVLPEHTSATEGWAPHLPVARKRLAPLGIDVHEHDSAVAGSRLPFADASFDLVLSRHESFAAADIARVLRPGGTFLTEQVGVDDGQEIRELFSMDDAQSEATLESTMHALSRAGLRIDRSDTFHGSYEFDDVPTLLRSLRRFLWDAPEDLDADRHRDALEHLHAQVQQGPFLATVSRHLVQASAPETLDSGRTDFSTLLGEQLDVPRV
ncbi:class I SAM-dependent methyltransferase [Brachybacterium paraconglomeratum]|uniref:class I SAM-dependent methyltransferase n=1 Tax=Brachybacterium paraconglomeratum TaxID=173362 RepID=UPI0031E8E7D6